MNVCFVIKLKLRWYKQLNQSDFKYLANRADSSGGVVLIALARELAISE